MRNTFLWEQFLEGRSTVSRTNEKETAIMNKFPHIISYVVLIHSEEKDEEETQPNTKQNKTKQERHFPIGSPLALCTRMLFLSSCKQQQQPKFRETPTHAYVQAHQLVFVH
jgi:hypothetical protein